MIQLKCSALSTRCARTSGPGPISASRSQQAIFQTSRHSKHREDSMLPPDLNIVDLSLELDPKHFAMRTPAGFKKDMQFAMEVIKEHDAPGGAGQIVRGVHMRLHAGSHVDAPEHNVPGGTQIHQLPLETFIG